MAYFLKIYNIMNEYKSDIKPKSYNIRNEALFAINQINLMSH